MHTPYTPHPLPTSLADLRPMPGVPGIWTSDPRDEERELGLLERGSWHPAERRFKAHYRDRLCSVEAYGSSADECIARLRAAYVEATQLAARQMNLLAAVERMQVAS